MNSPKDGVPLAVAWDRPLVLQEELRLAKLVFDAVMKRGKTEISEPTIEAISENGDMTVWAELCGFHPNDLLDRMVQHSGVPMIPLSTAHPTGLARALAERMRHRVGEPLRQPLPWLPVDSIGPFLVMGHFCPYSTNYGGIPEDLVIRVILTRGDYERIYRIPEIAALMRINRANESFEKATVPEDEPGWLKRILQSGGHSDADNLDHLAPEEAMQRLKSDPAITSAIAMRLSGVRTVPTLALAPNLSAFEVLPRKLSHAWPVLCYFVTGHTRHVLVSDIERQGELQDELTQQGGERVLVVASQVDETEIRRLIDSISGGSLLKIEGDVESVFTERDRTLELDPAMMAEMTDDRINKLLGDEDSSRLIGGTFIYRGVLKNASDLHIEPVDRGYRLRYRINGELVEIGLIPGDVGPRLIAALKSAAKMNTAEKRLPQDGRLLVVLGKAKIEVRISTEPVRGKEGMVLRLKNRSASRLTIETIGMRDYHRALTMEALNAPNGIFIVTGATGSGKTTTLDACIHFLNRPHVKIVTLEDPIELIGDGLQQIEINPEIGLDFGRAFKHALRHDPDILVIGEVRDPESAQAAIFGANTGHNVFCSMHTNDAPTVLERLRSFGLSNNQISSSVNLVVGQTLVRTLCSCATRRPVTKDDEILFAQAGITELPKQLMVHNGCTHCGGTGFSGRRAVMEFMPKTPDMAFAIHEGKNYLEIRKIAERYGYKPLFTEAMTLAAQGITTVGECVGARMPFLNLAKTV